MIVIIDYGAGNIASIRNMLRKVGVDSSVSGDPAEIGRAQKLILPGVGHFDHGMQELTRRELVAPIVERTTVDKVPLLGICLGAQLLARGSEEGTAPGLGLIAADVKKFDASRLGPALKIPHMGWADVEATREHPLLQNVPKPPRFYFVHSYHLVCDDPGDVLVTATHCYSFVAGVARENIFGMQFHPEKSHAFGMHLLKNFAQLS